MVEKPVLVRSAMRAAPLELPGKTTVRQACAAMRSRRVEEVLVIRDSTIDGLLNNVMGILTESDAIELLARGGHPTQMLVADVMRGPLQTISPNDTIDDALKLFRALRIHRLPVVEGNRIIGLLTRDSLLEAQNARLTAFQELTERLEDEAHHDPLTGLANRRAFDEVLDREIALHERTDRGLGLLMIDIDHFKDVNDTYGHARGDAVLRELALRLKTSVRRSDLVARYGGEEFTVLVTTPSANHLLTLAEKLRVVVCRDAFVAPDEDFPLSSKPGAHEGPMSGRNWGALSEQPDLSITISIGATMYGGIIDGSKRLVRTADGALYEAKNSGRNCVRLGVYRGSTPFLRPPHLAEPISR